jgi:inner membrane protein
MRLTPSATECLGKDTLRGPAGTLRRFDPLHAVALQAEPPHPPVRSFFMASVGHVVVGAWGARMVPLSAVRWRDVAVLASLSLLPDLDVVAFALGIPYAAPFGHRGASHSLAAALLVGLAAALLARGYRARAVRTGVVVALVVASHGLLDALTDGGLGAALLWPFSNERFFAPWRPLPVAPIGARFWSARGLAVVWVELLWFAPLAAWTAWARERRTPSLPSS